jgi:hypothetical protein
MSAAEKSAQAFFEEPRRFKSCLAIFAPKKCTEKLEPTSARISVPGNVRITEDFKRCLYRPHRLCAKTGHKTRELRLP